MISNFSEWLSEAEGVSRAIAGHLKNFFSEHGKDASYQDACDYIESKVKGWKLSKEDFEEGKMMVKEYEEIELTPNVNEGKMKHISMISQESTDKEDFRKRLVEYLESVGKKDLANDKEFIDEMVEEYQPKK